MRKVNLLIRVTVLLPVMIIAISMVGCEQTGPKAANGDHHEHDGEHSHDSGYERKKYVAEDGHGFSFQPNDFAGEWGHTFNSDLIQIFILDKETKDKKPIKVDSIAIRRGEQIFSLDAEGEDEQGLSHTYSLDNKELAIAMNLGVTLEMTVGDVDYTAKIAPHSH